MFFFTNKNYQNVEKGKKVFEWEAFNYYPYKRTWLWYFIFSFFMFGIALVFLLTDEKWGWVPSLTLFIVLSIYFWKHSKTETHIISFYQKEYFQVDNKIFSLKDFSGFWFIIDHSIAVINFELKDKKDEIITFQMGEKSDEFFRENLKTFKLEELKNKKESLLNLWIRVLKL